MFRTLFLTLPALILFGALGLCQTAEAQFDFSVTAITAPTTAPTVYSASQVVSFTVQNLSPMFTFGDQFAARYRVDGGSFSDFENPCSGAMASGGSLTCNFQARADFSAPGPHTVQVQISLNTDNNPGNNSLTTVVNSLPPAASAVEISNFPYSEGFESGAGNWTAASYNSSLFGSSTSFVLGTPAKTKISGAGGGTKSWVTDLTNPYGVSTNTPTRTQVISPVFDFRNVPLVDLSLKVAWESSPGDAGARLQSSLDDGFTWQNVGTTGEPDNWYNNSSADGLDVFAGNGADWGGYVTAGSSSTPYYTSGTGAPGYLTTGSQFGSNGYVTSRHLLAGGAKARLRVAFGAIGTGDEGFAFDDVTINAAFLASETAALLLDQDNDGRADAGDTIRHTVVLTNPGLNAVSGATFQELITDSNITLNAGTVTTTQGTVSTGNTGGDATISINLGTLAPSSTVTVTYDVTVANINSNVLRVCSQGLLSATSFGALYGVTDDPGTTVGLDPTCTAAFVDSDNDGVPDGSDICPGFSDSVDTDQDTFPDGCDLCPFADDRVDSQPNGIPDCQEPAITTGTDGSCNSGGSDCANQSLLDSVCVGANGFHSQTNILTVQNKLATSLPVGVKYFDQGGTLRGSVGTAVVAKGKQDFIINALGLQANSIGTVCVYTNSGVGAWTGGLAIYKPNLRSGGSGFDYALYYPMVNPFSAPSSTTLNTYHLGVSPAAIVSNYISLADGIRGDGKPLTGAIHYYDGDGLEIGTATPVFIPDGAREDFDAHRVLTGNTNRDAIGTAEFVPAPLSGGGTAKFYMTSTRYYYDCFAAGCSDFLTAFVLNNRPASDLRTAGGVSTKNGEFAIVETSNYSGSSAQFSINVTDEVNGPLGGFTFTDPAHTTRHFIMNRIGTDGFVGAETFASANMTLLSGKASATTVNYKVDPVSGKLLYAYSSPFLGATNATQVSGFNTFISHGNLGEFINSGTTQETVNVQFLDFNGASLGGSAATLDPQQSFHLSPSLAANNYGSVVVTASSPNIVSRNFVSRSGEYAMCVPAL